MGEAAGAGALPAARKGPSSGLGVRLGSLFGVEIALDGTLLVAFVLVALQLGLGVLPAWHPSWPPVLRWSIALTAAALFFASIVAHELSHALVAAATGARVRRITLFLFGGIAHLDEEPRTPRSELLVAIVGPLCSLAIGFGATLVGVILEPAAARLLPVHPGLAYAELGPLATLFFWLGPMNVALAIFNLVPGFPLDGGRVLRAALWWATGDLRRATRWASSVGRLVGIGLVVLGVGTALGGNLGSGLWSALVGWFLYGAAARGYQQVVVREALAGVAVGRVMRPQTDAVTPHDSIERLVLDHFVARDEHTVPVVEDGALVGVVSANDVRRVTRAAWPSTAIAAVMTPAARLPTLGTDAPAADALEQLATTGYDQLPVVENGVVRGIVRLGDILRWMAVTEPELT